MRYLKCSPMMFLLWTSCATDGNDANAVTRTDSAGIEIVVSTHADTVLNWAVNEVLRLGGEESGPQAFFRIRDDGLATDSAGNLYILDAGNFRVLKFDRLGTLLATFGREGGGPGEFQFPALLTVSPEGEVLVQDYGKTGVMRFAPDGTPLNSYPAEGIGVLALQATPHGLLMAYRRFGSQAPEDTSRVSLITATDTTDLTFLTSPAGEVIQLESCGISFSGMGPVLEVSMKLDSYGGRTAVISQASYSVDVYEGSARVASFRRNLPDIPVTRERAIAELGEGMRVALGAGGEPRTCDSEEVVDKRGIAEMVPQNADVAVSPDGSIWIKRKGVAQEDAPIDILDATGVYVGTLVAGTPFPSAFFPNGDYVAVERDELEVEYVVTYRVGTWEGS